MPSSIPAVKSGNRRQIINREFSPASKEGTGKVLQHTASKVGSACNDTIGTVNLVSFFCMLDAHGN